LSPLMAISTEKMNVDHNNRTLGRCWVAVRDEHVVSLLPMVTHRSLDLDRDQFREQAKALLSTLGEVMTGELVVINGVKYFQKRLTHINRGKSPRKPAIYAIAPWMLSGLT